MKVTEFFNNLGINKTEDTEVTIPYEISDYQLTEDACLIRTHRDFLANLEQQEEKRLEAIESKTSNLISQTAIVFSLLGLFIPILIDKTSDFGLGWKIPIIGLMLFASAFYLLTIHNALKNYQIPKFIYIRSMAKNVLDFKDKSEGIFLAEEVRDLLLAIPNNKHINNRKGNNLVHSYFAFRLANILTGILVGVFSGAMLFYTEEKKTVAIIEPVEIKHLDSLVKSSMNYKNDTIILQIHTTSGVKTIHKVIKARTHK